MKGEYFFVDEESVRDRRGVFKHMLYYNIAELTLKEAIPATPQSNPSKLDYSGEYEQAKDKYLFEFSITKL